MQQRHPLSRPRPSARCGHWWLVLCLLSLLLYVAPVRAAQFGEYEIKAGFLYNFLNFVSWSEAPEGAASQMMLVIFDTGTVGKAIADTLATESVRGKPLKIIRTTQPAEARKGHLVFIPATYPGEPDKIFQAVQGRPVLTVGESDTFIASGGMINFVRQGAKIRFEINPRAAQNAGLKISSQLLRLAIITDSPHSGLDESRLVALSRRPREPGSSMATMEAQP